MTEGYGIDGLRTQLRTLQKEVVAAQRRVAILRAKGAAGPDLTAAMVEADRAADRMIRVARDLERLQVH